MKKPDIQDLKDKVERFPWENYKISHQGSKSDLITLYWYCVISDMIRQHKKVEAQNVNWKEVRNDLGERLYYSYLNCFFKIHELYHSLLKRFEGFHIIKYNEEREDLKNWKDTLRDKTWTVFIDLFSASVKNYKVKEGVYSDLSFQNMDITAFDDASPKIPQEVSTVLVDHLKNGTMNARQSGSKNAIFFFNIKNRVIEQSHSYGLEYVKFRMTTELLNDIDAMFERGDRIIRSKKKLSKDQSIKDAILDLFKKWPQVKEYSNLEIASAVKQKYKDSDGRRLEIDSIKKALRRMKNKKE